MPWPPSLTSSSIFLRSLLWPLCECCTMSPCWNVCRRGFSLSWMLFLLISTWAASSFHKCFNSKVKCWGCLSKLPYFYGHISTPASLISFTIYIDCIFFLCKTNHLTSNTTWNRCIFLCLDNFISRRVKFICFDHRYTPRSALHLLRVPGNPCCFTKLKYDGYQEFENSLEGTMSCKQT